MTVTNRYVAPIEVAEQPGGLMQTARPLPISDWRGGITFTSVCTTLGRWGCVTNIDPATNTPGDEKTIDARTEPERFDPFMLYSGVNCSGAPNEQELRGIARAGLTRGRSGEIAHELVTSLSGNPDLSGYASDLTPATPGDLKSALSVLLSAIADMGGGEVMLHAHTAALPYLLDANVEWRGNGYFLGHIPVSVDDYPFTAGREADGNANPSWTPLYMTRPVEIAHTVASDDYDVNTRQNEGQAISEDFAVLRFETCAAYAIIADLGA